MLKTCVNISNYGSSGLEENHHLLASVNLSNYWNITDICLPALIRSCPLLSHVDLLGCSNDNDMGVSALIRGCPLLSHVDLLGCSNDTDMGVSALGRSCPLLSGIILYNCVKIADISVSTILITCRHLRLLQCDIYSGTSFALRRDYSHLQIWQYCTQYHCINTISYNFLIILKKFYISWHLLFIDRSQWCILIDKNSWTADLYKWWNAT